MGKEYVIKVLLFVATILSMGNLSAKVNYLTYEMDYAVSPVDSGDTVDLTYPHEDNSVSPFNSTPNPLDLADPSNITQEIVYDPVTGNYYVVSKLGDSLNYRPVNYMTFDEYLDYDLDRALNDYWQQKNATESEFNKDDPKSKDLIPSLNVDSKGFDNIFGGNTIDIRPSGSAKIKFGLKNSKTQNPALTERQRSITTFDFDQQIQVNLIGNIGDKLKLSINYNTEATFDFENQVKIDFTGYDDDIIQKIEAGNVSLPLSGSLITGSQSLFGLKTKLKFGRLEITSVISQQKGKKKEIEVKGGAQVKEYELKADEYDQNRHYFISQYFRDNYEEAMSSPPFVASPINVTRIEVWVTNNNNTTQNTRNVIAFQDLGEENQDKLYNQGGFGPVYVTGSSGGFPDNQANSLYNTVNLTEVKGYTQASTALEGLGFKSQEDYQKVGLARLLSNKDYSFNPLLGVISLNMEMQPNQVLSVSFQYTYQNQLHQVGEFSTDVVNEKAIFSKMLKSSKIITTSPMWDLMMKNVYSLGAYQVQASNFKFDIWYLDRRTGVPTNYLPSGPSSVSGIPLIQVMNLDQMDRNMHKGPDGVFDFLTGPTNLPYINPRNGKVFFPVLEPFGSHIHNISGGDAEFIEKYAFDSLYTNTKPNARAKFPNKNRFYFKGKYESSISSDISVGAMQIPEGSVKVTAGGRQLVEGSDYTVDYNLGRVKILNQGLLESGIPIKISVESNSLFNIQTRTMLASRFDFKFSEDLILGGTIMRLSERPLTQKTSYGDEPISNTVWGVDGTYRKESPFLTRLVDNIPGIDTKEKSNFLVTGEFAQFIPGHSKAIGAAGTSYIDDFEGSQSTIDLRSRTSWSLASIPQNQPLFFPEASLLNNVALGFNRALFTWYTIDPLFFRNDSRTPAHIKNDPAMQSNHFMRQITVTEVFEKQQVSSVQNQNIPTLDLAFYPDEKGQNNYDVNGKDSIGDVYAAGIKADGTLIDPQSRWGGIQRKVNQQNFEALNIEYIQIWVMDPFNEDYPYSNDDGDLYINLGSVSEDVQRDGHNFFENGLSYPPTAIASEPYTSSWGRYTPGNQIVNGFDNDPDARQYQDVGLDGLRDDEEKLFFSTYTNQVTGIPALENDISQDNFEYYRTDNYDNQEADILTRYKKFNGYDGNSPLSSSAGAAAVGSTRPNQEDINKDKNIDETESYWQYRIRVNKADFNKNNIGKNYITDVRTATIQTKDGRSRDVDWYQLKIPVRQGVSIGGIRDFRSIRFLRVFMRGFEHRAVMRFARFELVRGEWRKYDGSLEDPGDYILGDDFTNFDVSAVNVEVNSSKKPVNYTLPPFIQRETNVGSTNLNQLNEQSLALNICELPDGQGRAVYRSFELDVLSYNTIKMYVHAESYESESVVNDGDLVAFMRVGTDFDNNYYEYEIPLKVTLPGQYNGDDDQQRLFVWPEANNMEVSLEDFKEIKVRRNKEAIVGGTLSQFDSPYSIKKGKARITIVGNPSLNGVKTIMLGVRNPRQIPGDIVDDGEGKCAEIWFNELRLSDFDDQSGWATIVRASTKLADFANLSVSGSMSTPGWGSIDKKISERQRETRQDVDVQANVELGKFFGKKSGIKIPTYAGYTVGIVKPQYAPLAPDIKFERYVKEAFPAGRAQDSVRNIQQKVVTRKSLNFTNVRKERTNSKKKKKVYDISNFALNYSYNSIEMHDFETEFDNMKTYRAGVSYNFSTAPKNIKPFAKNKLMNKTKWLTLVKDINFYPFPKSYSFSTDVNRQYQESRTRNNNPELLNTIPVYVNKTFDWNRSYALRWDLTRAIKFDFTARNKSLIREPLGQPDTNRTAWNDTVMQSLREFGTNLNYNHAMNLTWAVPINKIPVLDWTNTTVKYGSTYSWARAPFIVKELGNTIQNTQTMQVNGTLNFVNLYNKSKYLKKVNSKRPGKKLNNSRKESVSRKEDTGSAKTEKPKKDGPPGFVDGIARILMMIRKGNISYAVTNGIMLPGYKNETEFIGMNSNFSAPGLGFVFGQQNGFDGSKDFLEYAKNKDWLVKKSDFNNQYREATGKKLNLKLTVEPIRDFRVELSTNWNDSRVYTTYNRYYDSVTFEDGSNFNRDSPIEQGNFSTSFFMFKTSFGNDGDNYISNAFEEFSKNRVIISERLGEESIAANSNEYSQGKSDSGYYDGFGPNHANVLIPAFLAGYSGKSAESISTNVFSKMYIPNLRLTYTGLGKLPSLKKHVRNISISSGYKSTYSVGGFTSNILYKDGNEDGFTAARDTASLYNNFVSKYNYNGVTLREAFSPLINIDVTLKNSVQIRFEIKKDRTINLSTRSLQVMEIRGQEFTLGLGYTFKQLRAPFQNEKNRKAIKSDFKVRADFSIRKNLSITRQLDTKINPNNPTNGQNTLSVKLTGDYKLSRKLTLRLYFDYISNKPVISLSYPNSTTNGGFSIRFNLNG